MTQKQLFKVAKEEIREWRGLPRPLVLAILFCFIHRVTTGRTVEETFFSSSDPIPDYEI